MKFILFILINIVFSNSLYEWIDLNSSIINSKIYEISFEQEYETDIRGELYHKTNQGKLIYFDKRIKYETNKSVLLINSDSLTIFNKYTKQIFIDYINDEYNLLLNINPLDVLLKSYEINKNQYHFKDSKYPIEFEIYFSNNKLDQLYVLFDDTKLKFLNITLLELDSTIASNHFKTNTDSYEVFDLRIK